MNKCLKFFGRSNLYLVIASSSCNLIYTLLPVLLLKNLWFYNPGDLSFFPSRNQQLIKCLHWKDNIPEAEYFKVELFFSSEICNDRSQFYNSNKNLFRIFLTDKMLKFNSTQLLGLPTLVKHAHQIVINILQ